ncbi:MAG: glycosyltransferase family 9 protein [Chromatiaceae bacterium]|nr:glycosyltransferase family 9 protein [Chromatiaceae bacterium]
MNTPPRILLVRLSAIGDILFASPLVTTLRRTYPRAHIAWLVQPEYLPLLEHHPDLDEVILWPVSEWRGLWRRRRLSALMRSILAFRKRLRSHRFDMALDLQGLFKSGLLTRLSGAAERIGLGSREGSRWFMTRSIPRGGDSVRIGSEYLYLAETLGLSVSDFPMAVHYGAGDDKFARDLIDRWDLGGGFAAICPFTTRPQKHWFEPRWAQLSDRIYSEMGLPVVLLGGPQEREGAARICDLAARSPVDLTGRTTLLEAAAIIDRSALLVGVDTGLSHMGVAFGRPTLLLFGSTCPYLDTGQPSARVLYHRLDCSPCKRKPTCNGAFTCMDSIRVDEALSAARALLGHTT